ncbi:soma ferritin-like [Diorhabda carinulata]|uniref:soma ferritin-like n=1 Tax=Diorhabda carinulata TaxID=1163345 RepID=UPI0025A1411D|nr:soma ferritin-like [Diorhabda carinulata]
MKLLPKRFNLWQKEYLTDINRNLRSSSVRFPKIAVTNTPSLLSIANNTFKSRRFMCNSGKDDECQKEDDYGKHQFHEETEAVLNEQVLSEFMAAFEYLSIGYYFGRTDVALPGCQGFFMNMYEEELGHANIFSNYVLMRGGEVKITNIKIPENKNWTVTDAFRQALNMEKDIKEKLTNVYDVAEKHKDLQIMDLVSTDFMEEQNRSICEMARLVTRSKITDSKVGEYLFDQMIFKSFVKKEKGNLMYNRQLDLIDDKDKQGIYK